MKRHTDESVSTHLAMAMTLILEQQELLIDLVSRVTAITEAISGQNGRIAIARESSAAALTSSGVLQKMFTEDSAAMNKNVHRIATVVKNEVRRRSSDVHALNTDVQRLQNHVSSLSDNFGQMHGTLSSGIPHSSFSGPTSDDASPDPPDTKDTSDCTDISSIPNGSTDP